MGELLIGTSGYDYPEWRGSFYPLDLRREDFLSFYAERFNALELSFPYFSQPTASQLSGMVRKTGGQVRFSVKGNRRFTHEAEVGRWRDAAREYRDALYPLVNEGLLASVLLQFPEGFRYTTDNRRYLAELLGEFTDYPIVVEFRHREWLRPQVFDGLSARGVGVCASDTPLLSGVPGLVPRFTRVTGESGYVRLHGRDSRAWFGTDDDYFYQDGELESFVPLLRSMADKARLVQVYFNNHARGAAALNARRIKLLAAPVCA